MTTLGSGTILDIGCGAGRHTRLFDDHGFRVDAIDSSEVPLSQFPAASRWGVRRAYMNALPYRDECFEFALAFGVFYYGTSKDHEEAVAELYRVLKPGGKALVVTRTADDSRRFIDEPIDMHTQRLHTGDEKGMLINFLDSEDVRRVYKDFSKMQIDKTETSRDGGTWLDSDWLLRLTK